MYQRLTESMLSDFNHQNLLICFNNVMLYSASIEDLVTNPDVVLTRLEEQGVKLKTSKCHFFKRKINYLGHVLSEEGISYDPQKTEATDSWPTPTSETELRSFLGLAGYYWRMLPGFSKGAAPLQFCSAGQRRPRRNPNERRPLTVLHPFSFLT